MASTAEFAEYFAELDVCHGAEVILKMQPPLEEGCVRVLVSVYLRSLSRTRIRAALRPER